ncbi:hypothetical protein ACHAWF_012742 [Thalassiosira exigua]
MAAPLRSVAAAAARRRCLPPLGDDSVGAARLVGSLASVVGDRHVVSSRPRGRGALGAGAGLHRGELARPRPRPRAVASDFRGMTRESIRALSSSASAPSSPSRSLKRMIRPFLRACHPDAAAASLASAEEGTGRKKRGIHPLSARAKEINLAAVQTVNGLVDLLDDAIGRCTPPSYSGKVHRPANPGPAPEVEARYEVEFVLPTHEPEEGPIKRRRREPLTLRSVTLSFPARLRSEAQKWARTPFPDRSSSLYSDPESGPSKQEEEAFAVAAELRDHAASEFARLLTIAGMTAPAPSGDDMQFDPGRSRGRRKEADQWTLSDHFLHELGIDPSRDDDADDPASGPESAAYFGRTGFRPSPSRPLPPARAHREAQRRAFVASVPWQRFADDYDQAFEDARADWTTERLNLYNSGTLEGRERRERFVSDICGSVRIRRSEEGSEEIPEGLEVAAQLVAIRRLSLILYDNFDYLRMERMGRMWERFTIVLTPPRGSRERRLHPGSDRAPAPRRQRRKLNKWERRKRLRERLTPGTRGHMRHDAMVMLGSEDGQTDAVNAKDSGEENLESLSPSSMESGFKFSYGTRSDQGEGHVTAYIPIDFEDDELVKQLYTHLYDYFDTCCGHVGFLRYDDGAGTLKADFDDDGSMKGRKKRMEAEE